MSVHPSFGRPSFLLVPLVSCLCSRPTTSVHERMYAIPQTRPFSDLQSSPVVSSLLCPFGPRRVSFDSHRLLQPAAAAAIILPYVGPSGDCPRRARDLADEQLYRVVRVALLLPCVRSFVGRPCVRPISSVRPLVTSSDGPKASERCAHLCFFPSVRPSVRPSASVRGAAPPPWPLLPMPPAPSVRLPSWPAEHAPAPPPIALGAAQSPQTRYAGPIQTVCSKPPPPSVPTSCHLVLLLCCRPLTVCPSCSQSQSGGPTASERARYYDYS